MDREDQKLRVQQATDIVELIGENLALKPAGREFKCLCPFHDDHDPSMHVVPHKQIYKCFSCGAGGDVFTFMMAYHRMTFPEALKALAERAHIELQPLSPMQQGQATQRQTLGDANARAVTFFRRMLEHPEHGRVARAYLDKRGISPAMVEAFGIGAAPDRWDGMASVIAQKGWDTQPFIEAGLITPRKEHQGQANPRAEQCYDRFRHRLIFPIFDTMNRPIAFGGRKLREEDEPKYYNSAEHELFNKSATLFGIHLAKKAIIDTQTAIITEGYTDVIACHQAGICNVVATLGTAFTAQHIAQLRRYAQRVVLIFDADEAGQKAADRAVELFVSQSMDVSIAVLPDGLDPADLLAQPEGPARWAAAVDTAVDAIEYQLQRLGQTLGATSSLSGRQQVAEAFVQKLVSAGLAQAQVLRRSMILQRVADLLRVPEQSVQQLALQLSRKSTGGRGTDNRNVQKSTENTGANVVHTENLPKMASLRLAEKHLIGALLCDPALFHHTLPDGQTLDEAITPADLVTPAASRLYERVYDRLCEHQSMTLASLIGELAELGKLDLVQLATECEQEIETTLSDDPQRITRALIDAASAIRQYHGHQAYDQTRQALTDVNPSDLLLKQIAEHNRKPSILPRRLTKPRP